MASAANDAPALDNSNSLILIWGGLVLSVLSNLAVPGLGALPTMVFYIAMWQWKRSDPYLDWNARETIRATIVYFVYLCAIFLGGATLENALGERGYVVKAFVGSMMWALMIFVLLNAIRQIMAVHRRQLFVFPLTFSPRWQRPDTISWIPRWVVMLTFPIYALGLLASLYQYLQSDAPARAERIIERFNDTDKGAPRNTQQAATAQAPAPATEDHLLVANSQLYLCDTEAHARELFAKAAGGTYTNSTQLIQALGQAYCPMSKPTALITGVVVHDEVLNPPQGGYDRIRIVAVTMSQGSPRYATIIRAGGTGLWHDSISIIFAARTVGGVLEFFQQFQQR